MRVPTGITDGILKKVGDSVGTIAIIGVLFYFRKEIFEAGGALLTGKSIEDYRKDLSTVKKAVTTTETAKDIGAIVKTSVITSAVKALNKVDIFSSEISKIQRTDPSSAEEYRRNIEKMKILMNGGK